MGKDKSFRKSLKGPDQFQTSLASWFDKAYAYRTQIAAAISVILVVLAGIIGWQYYQGHKKDQRQQALAEIESVYTEELKAAAEKRSQLQEGLKDIATKDEKKLTKNEQATKTAIEAQIEAIKPIHDESVAKYKAFMDKYIEYPEGWMAGFRVAADHLKKEEFTEAKDILVKVMAKANGVLFYELQGRFLLANVLAELKEFDPALKEVDVLISKANSDLKPRMLLLKGRILVAKQDIASAKEAFDQLIKDHSASSEAQKARAMKAVWVR